MIYIYNKTKPHKQAYMISKGQDTCWHHVVLHIIKIPLNFKLAYVLKSVVDIYSSLRLVSYFEEFTMTAVTQAVILMHLEQIHILFYV